MSSWAWLCGGARPGLDSIERFGERIFSNFRVVSCLGSQPVALGQAEESAQAKVRIGRDSSFACHDLADSLGRYADLFGKTVLGDGHRNEKLIAEQLARCHGFESLHGRLV